MSPSVDTIAGIGPAYRAKLEAARIFTIEDLINRCGSPAMRKQTAAEASISQWRLQKWVRAADLMRLNGIGPEISELLGAAGAPSLAQLRACNPEGLHSRLIQVNESARLARRTPGLPIVSHWIDKAQQLEQLVF